MKSNPPSTDPINILPYPRKTTVSAGSTTVRSRTVRWPQRIVEGVKTFAWVAPLTILIWVYAEREQLVPRDNVSVPVEISTDATDRVVTIMPPQDKNIVVALEGPQVGVDRVQSYCKTEASQKPLNIFFPKDELPIGNPRSIQIVDRLQSDRLFRDNAVKITKAIPTYFMVSVEKRVKARLPVEIAPENQQAAAGVKFYGEQDRTLDVEVSGPESLLADSPAKPRPLKIYVDIDALGNRKGRFETAIPLRLNMHAEGVTFPPAVQGVVDATQTHTFTLPSIPVYILAARSIIDGYRIEVTPAVQDVTVVGPPQSIDMLKATTADPLHATEVEPFVAYAVLRINNADLRGDDEQKTRILTAEDFHLPKDVTITGGPKEIKFRLTPRPHDAEP